MKQAPTAIAVYHELEPTLGKRQIFIREQLEAFLVEYEQAPTALELLRFIAARFPLRQFDCNSVRPRLNEPEKFGWVAHGKKRLCTVTGKKVWTWTLSTPKPPTLEPVPQRLNF